MSTIGQSEKATHNRVIALFRDELGTLPGCIDYNGSTNQPCFPAKAHSLGPEPGPRIN